MHDGEMNTSSAKALQRLKSGSGLPLESGGMSLVYLKKDWQSGPDYIALM
jgi:hypothetical protein